MKSLISRIFLLSTPLLLSGCCYFTPCHRGTYMTGVTTDAVSHQPIHNAAVRLYHYETRTARSGCYSLGGADALPFEFHVSAPGYKPIATEAVPGSYQATVTLVPEGSSGESSFKVIEISRDRYAELSRSCP
ncbi:carboxypeptidase regulatory-like domain-containing protein [Xanthomonas vesicatoria]|nr:carboxypeptidase regulatory-like domain-containing protein [Xanthomonas vesicatoria]MDG4490579.1 carboxypeptidase regulatory-like domain-containing protein [Xanthomonas vesicatoria]